MERNKRREENYRKLMALHAREVECNKVENKGTGPVKREKSTFSVSKRESVLKDHGFVVKGLILDSTFCL